MTSSPSPRCARSANCSRCSVARSAARESSGSGCSTSGRSIPATTSEHLLLPVTNATDAQQRTSWHVAAGTPIANDARPTPVDDVATTAESSHQLLVDNLCALLTRSEIRALIDVRALVEPGADLPRALRGCSRRDPGFSPVTLAWSAQSLGIRGIAETQAGPSPRSKRSNALERPL